MDAHYKTREFWIAMAMSTLFALVVPVAALRFIDIRALSRDDLIAVMAGLMTLSVALLIGATGLMPKPQISRRQSVLAGLSMASCAVTLMIPPLARDTLAPGVGFGLFLLLLALGYVTSGLVRKGWDEMQRRMVADSSVAGYHVFATGIMLYAAALAFGLDIGIGLWALIAILTVAQLFISSWVGWKRQAPLPKE